MTTPTVRPATHDDLDALVDLREAVAAEGIWIATEAPIDRARDRTNMEATIADQADGRSAVLFVAVVDGRVVGSIYLGNSRGIAHLGMQVDAAHRGQGIGSALLAAGLEWARGAEVHKVELEHWPWNHGARALYEGHGFVEEGYRRRQYRRRDGSLWDSVVMGLVLDTRAPGHERGAQVPPT